MKKIIKGRLYDTGTAYCVAYKYHAIDGYTELLYRKKTGEYFLWAGWGQNDTTAHITPLPLWEAMLWAEDNASIAEYIDEFGLPDE